MEIDKKLYEEIKQYCDLNGLKPKEYIHKLLKKAFMEDKYGKMPSVLVKKDKQATEIHVKPAQGAEKIERVVVIHENGEVTDVKGSSKKENIMAETAAEQMEVKIPKIEEKSKENVNLPKSKKVKL